MAFFRQRLVVVVVVVVVFFFFFFFVCVDKRLDLPYKGQRIVF